MNTRTLYFSVLAIAVLFIAGSYHEACAQMNTSTDGLAKAIISFTFDDGFQSVYTNALPVLNSYNFKATDYITTINVGGLMSSSDGGGPAITWPQLWDLYHTYDWEIGNHTVFHPHLTTYSDYDIIWEVRGARQMLADHGILNVTDFAYPYGEYNEHIIDLLEHDGTLYSARTSGYTPSSATNTLSNFNQWALIAVDIDYPEDVASVESLIDQAIADKSWLILYCHDITTGSNPSEEQITIDSLSQIVQYVHNQSTSLDVVTISKGVSLMLQAKSLMSPPTSPQVLFPMVTQ